MRITDNYQISSAIIDYVNAQGVPTLNPDELIALAPKFSEYKDNNFVYTQNPVALINVNELLLEVDTEIRHYKNDMKLQIPQETLKSQINTLYEKALEECKKELTYLHKQYNFTVSPKLSEIDIYDSEPEKSLMFAEDYEEAALTAYEEFLGTQLGLGDKLSELVHSETEEVPEAILELDRFYEYWDPSMKPQLFKWIHSPEEALNAVLEPINALAYELKPSVIASTLIDQEG